MQKKVFDVFIFFLCFWSLAGVFGVEVKSVSVTEGDSVTLPVKLTQIQENEEIEWKFEDILIADINRKDNNITYYNNAADGRFRDRLKLDTQSGSLTIMNTTTKHTGLYKVTRDHWTSVNNTFSLTIYAHLAAPVINRDCSSSVQYCSVLCSVVNVSAVSLSWYKGNSLLSSISVFNLSISLSLPLEVEYQDKNTYSCVVYNPISNQTTDLNISTLCQPCPEHTHRFGVIEAVIRLVLSALVGVAAVALLIYDIRSRHFHLRRRVQTSASNTD
ncbi:SLAM family member 5-like [Danio rerio]|uniref:SLAM family member 5-like n=1 Tax=Danio rerio TaxID=7955 RepID=A0AC58IGH6_DANRE